MAKAETTPEYLGASSDKRTNRWSVTCPACTKSFEPPTTMLQFQELVCRNSKCSQAMVVDYNNRVVSLAPEQRE
jgi:hypothetical protein